MAEKTQGPEGSQEASQGVPAGQPDPSVVEEHAATMRYSWVAMSRQPVCVCVCVFGKF